MAGSMVSVNMVLMGKDFQMEVTGVLHSSRAMRQNGGSRRGTVLIGRIIQGEMTVMDEVWVLRNFDPNTEPIHDRVIRIETSRASRDKAGVNTMVGVCLSVSSMGDIIGRAAARAYDAAMIEQRRQMPPRPVA